MSHELSPMDVSAVVHVHEALTDLMRCRSEDWSELLPSIASEACAHACGSMDLLADAAVQAAAAAHRRAKGLN